MRFYADLHIHSKYSRATSRNSDLEHLALWAKRKGISVVGTGDFTHPAWFEEISEKLIPAEPGLFKLRPEIEREVDRRVPPSCVRSVRFLLEVEISTIYKKGEKTRKVHHLIYAPDLETVARLREKLDRIGNLASDGRPILGLDSRHLLEITLESGPGAFLIPAHIWTPWFAVLGSKSGFDAIEECYGDLSEHVFAVETGLSSDPPMNWRVSKLDRFTLVSNSDAHSPPMLGREACVFDTEMDYYAIRRSLESGEGYGGTVEFFPEEGKYHLDGHRACKVSLEPSETRKHEGRCPVCGKALTVGVMHRVEELADRPENYLPESPMTYRSMVPLPEIVSEIRDVGPKSKTVQRQIASLVSRLGPELDILETLPLEEVAQQSEPELVEALARLRRGEVHRHSGYDGEYGTIRLFESSELRGGLSIPTLFDLLPDPEPQSKKPPQAVPPQATPAEVVPKDASPGEAGPSLLDPVLSSPSAVDELKKPESSDPTRVVPTRPDLSSSPERGADENTKSAPEGLEADEDDPLTAPRLRGLDPEQLRAAEIVSGPLLIVAGPGTGKTRTLTRRLAHLIDTGVPPEACLAVTFTRRAADEMRERLEGLLGVPSTSKIWVTTFHGLGLRILKQDGAILGLDTAFEIADPEDSIEMAGELFGLARRPSLKLLQAFSRLRRECAHEEVLGSVPESGVVQAREWVSEKLTLYREALRTKNKVDFDDLLALPVSLLGQHPELHETWGARFQQISIDEYQDIDALQYQLIRLLVPPGGNLCAIGDPDQSIYRFRGADVGFFLRFQEDEPAAESVQLHRNYRSSASIVEAALQAVAPSSLVDGRELTSMLQGQALPIAVHRTSTARAEAEFVVHTIEQLLGGTSHFSLDSGRVESWDEADPLSFNDIAILYRTDAQAELILEALATAGLPSQKRSHQRLIERPEVRRLLAEVRILREEVPEPPSSVIEWLEKADERLRRDRDEEQDRDEEDEQECTPILGRSQALDGLLGLAKRFGEDLDGFLAEVTFGAEIDIWDPRAERLSLLTLHASKGLEFQVVFIIGCEDDFLPLRFGPEEGDIKEERRLFFVGLTRARRRLYLSHAGKRRLRGKMVERRPSPFLRDIEKRLLEQTESQIRSRRQVEAGVDRQMSLF